MGKKGGGSKPKAPDPYETAAAQFEYGNQSVYSPTGNMVYGTVGADGQFVANPNATKYAVQIQETPFQEQLRTAREGGALDLVGSIIGSGLPDRAQLRNTGDIAKNTFSEMMHMISPQREMEDRRSMQYFSDRGLPMTGEAAGQMMDDTSRRRGTQDAQLMRTALDRASEEQSRLYGLESNQRQGALNELVAAITGVNPSQNTINPSSSTGVDIASQINNQYQSKLAAYQQEQASQQNSMNALLGTAGTLGAAMIMSDVAMKQDIVPVDGGILDRLRSLPISTWRYTDASGQGDRSLHIGPMAQDFHKTFGVGDGKTISLVDVAGVALAALKELAIEVRHASSDQRAS